MIRDMSAIFGILFFCFFFFFKQKTAYEMRISDWSSDGCPSDLHLAMIALGKPLGCCVHRCDELNPSPCLPLHLTHRHAPFSQCGWFHLLACHDVMSKSLSYPSRQGFQRQSLGLMPRWTEPLRRRISTLA